MSARRLVIVTHAVFACDVQPYIGDGGRVWTCLMAGDEMACERFARAMRRLQPAREIEVRPYKRRRA